MVMTMTMTAHSISCVFIYHMYTCILTAIIFVFFLFHFQSAGNSIGLHAYLNSDDQCVMYNETDPFGWLQTWARICSSEFLRERERLLEIT